MCQQWLALIKVLLKSLKNDPKHNSSLLSYLCIIHQNVLCCKLGSCLEEVMKTAMNIASFTRAKYSLQHRQFKSVLEIDTQFDDLLLHNNVRRLSKGNVLQRYFELLNLIKLFLLESTYSAIKNHLKFINDNENIATMAFLTDIF